MHYKQIVMVMLRSILYRIICILSLFKFGSALAIEDYSANLKELSNNFCHYQELASPEYQYQVFKELDQSGGLVAQRDVLGQFLLKKEPSVKIDVFTNLVTRRNELGHQDKVFVKVLDRNIDKTCNSVECYLKNLFEGNTGISLFFLNYKFGLNASDLVWRNSSAPTESELLSWIKTLEITPPELTQFSGNQQLIKYQRGHDGNGVFANASIEFFDSWSSAPEEFRIYTTYHELSHQWAKSYGESLDKSKEWLSLSDWVEISRDKWRAGKEDQFVSLYAATNPSEDFAETSAAYRFVPEKLKLISEKKYKFMKFFVYGGTEFMQKTCKYKNHQKNIFSDYFKRNMKQIIMNTQEVVFFFFFDKFVYLDKNEDLLSCAESEIIKEISSKLYHAKLLPTILYNRKNQSFYFPHELVKSQIVNYEKYFSRKMKPFCPSRGEISFAYVYNNLGLYLKKFNFYNYSDFIPKLKKICERQ
ncbi:MAG: hypothetical protein KDD45_06525 [Bdellovibrionales bacterium]|nr:hypothetical protein [Bdellovibrionales bacterium]